MAVATRQSDVVYSCVAGVLSGRKRLKRVMDILSESDETELVTYTMTLVNKVRCHTSSTAV